MSQIRRRRLFVDAKLQGALLTHVALYWFYCLLSVAVIAVVWIVFAKRPATSANLFEEVWMNCGPALLGSVVLLPLVLLDCLRMSNRFAGPMVRIQSALRDLADGKTPRQVKLRDGDFWLSFADDVNRLIDMSRPVDAAPATAEPTAAEPTTGEPTTLATESPSVESPNIFPPVGPSTVSSATIYTDLNI